MPLNYNFEKVDLSKFSTEDAEMIKQSLHHFAYVCLNVGFYGPTKSNIEEFLRRYSLLNLHSPSWFSGDGYARNRWSHEFIRDHLVDRYTTNASRRTATEFNKNILSILADDSATNWGPTPSGHEYELRRNGAFLSAHPL